MRKFNTGKIMPRYLIIAVALTMVGLAIVGKALYLMTAKKDYWTEVAGRLKHDSIPMSPGRGNILSCDGQLMATSIPEYRIYIDFQLLVSTIIERMIAIIEHPEANPIQVVFPQTFMPAPELAKLRERQLENPWFELYST